MKEEIEYLKEKISSVNNRLHELLVFRRKLGMPNAYSHEIKRLKRGKNYP
jgi:hypothetical protein